MKRRIEITSSRSTIDHSSMDYCHDQQADILYGINECKINTTLPCPIKWIQSQQENDDDCDLTQLSTTTTTTPTTCKKMKLMELHDAELLSYLFNTVSPKSTLTPTSPITALQQQQEELRLLAPLPPLTVFVSAPTSSQEPSPQHKHKRVRFQLPPSTGRDLRNIFDDVYDEMVMMFTDDNNHEAEDATCGDESMTRKTIPTTFNKNDLFWDKKNVVKSRCYAQRKARIVMKKYPHEIQGLLRVIDHCKHPPTNEANSDETDNHSHAFMCSWSNSYVRGLEDYMTPFLSQRRRATVQQIVAYYKQLRMVHEQTQSYHVTTACHGYNNNDNDDTIIAEALQLYSSNLTFPSRNFARQLAIGDALSIFPIRSFSP